ncbi:hypothetical protein [Variovorax sp. PAMC26660]|uniref:hypothetical protein n=1 Tax=Variovorax sp. PAMC26660 TaxID=2762322 RepID=UPI00164E467D|nr:hypothetical protein [Variovorax sp. PAMC26660]QNK69196.1 hypothetical protein H7F35_05640 [Variovorax sp. PAMC26660]
MSKIALVNVALIVNGERRNFKPGEQLPELPEHDEEALIASKSIKDRTAESNAARASASEQRKGDEEFQEARLRVQAEADSRKAVDVSDAAAGTGAGGSANTGDIGALGTAIHGDGTDTALSPVSQAPRSSAGTAAAKTTPAVKNAAKPGKR